MHNSMKINALWKLRTGATLYTPHIVLYHNHLQRLREENMPRLPPANAGIPLPHK